YIYRQRFTREACACAYYRKKHILRQRVIVQKAIKKGRPSPDAEAMKALQIGWHHDLLADDARQIGAALFKVCIHKSAFCKRGLSQCPLRSESDRFAASPRNDAMCQSRSSAPQQKRLRPWCGDAGSGNAKRHRGWSLEGV